MFKLDLEKADVPEIKLPTSIGSSKKQENSRKTSASFKAFDGVDHNKLWKIIQEMGIPDYRTCLLRNLYADQEAAVITRYEIMDWFQIGKGVCQAIYCHPAYLTSMQSMRNAGLDEAQAGIKIAGRNINNLRNADDTTLMSTCLCVWISVVLFTCCHGR